ncbi:MAG: ribosomal protein S18-alanine N-acetyltransferase [Syntrophales bacterium]|nr:ribosomal protein S18-alanine N-acetyltransferase [Syntrophales bacterium]
MEVVFEGMIPIRVVSMEALHIDQVREIGKEAGFRVCSETYWVREIASLRCRAFVAEMESGDYVVGYVHAWCLAEEMQIIEVAVRQHVRRKGIATQLLTRLMGQAREEGIKKVYLEVRASNEEALRLYEKMGFIVRGIRKRYYQEEGEDGLLMEAVI